MSWRLAYSLRTLLNEANAVAPGRSKRYDGTIGDRAHQQRASRHNPNQYGVVCALDLTHDPAGGLDCASLFEFLRAYPHPNLAYIIHAGKVARRSTAWRVERYTGSNPHKTHIHVAVGLGADGDPLPPYDNTDPWGLEDWRGDDMTRDQDTILRQLRLSAVAQSHENEVTRTLLKELIRAAGGNPNAAAAQEAKKTSAVAAEKVRLKL